MFQFNVPEKDTNVGLESIDGQSLELHIAEATIELNDQMEVIDAEFETLEQALEAAESCELLAFSLETYGPQDATLALFNGSNNAICSLLGVEELPTAEQWEESGYTEVAMEGAKEVVKAAWEKIKAFFKKIADWIKSFINKAIEMIAGVGKKLENEIKRLKGLENPNAKDDSVKISPVLASEGIVSVPSTVDGLVKTIEDSVLDKGIELSDDVAAAIEKDEEDSAKYEETMKSLTEAAASVAEKVSAVTGEKEDAKPSDVGVKDRDSAVKACEAAKGVVDKQKDLKKKVAAISKSVKDTQKASDKAAKEAVKDESKATKSNAMQMVRLSQSAMKHMTKVLGNFSGVLKTYGNDVVTVTKTVQEGKKD